MAPEACNTCFPITSSLLHLDITVISYEVGNRHGEQSAAAVLVLVGISHSTNSVGLPTTASGDLSAIYIEPSDE